MTETIKRRVQYTVDKGTAEAAEYIISKTGLTPSTLLPLIYAEIERTGKIPVSIEVKPEDVANAKLIAASYHLPTKRIDTNEAINDFMSDDGGY